MTTTPPSPASPRPRFRRFASSRPLRVVALVLLVAIVLLVLLWDWNWFKGPVERIVEARTGRALVIGGDLDVDLGRTTTVRADALRFANADWSESQTMASVERLEIKIEVFPLLFKREVRLPEIRLVKPILRLETNSDGGTGNWDIAFGGGGDGPPPQIRRLWVEDGRLRYLDVPGQTDIDVRLASRESRGGEDAAPAIGIEGGGSWTNNRFTLEGVAESPLALQDTDKPYRIDLRARAGATRAHVRGSLVAPFQLRDFDLQFALSGRNLADLFPLVGVALPDTPPYALDGRLTRDAATWHYDGFTGKVGQSDLGGSAAITLGGERPFLKADLVSKRLDFDDLAGFIGGTPDTEGDALDPELVERERALAAKGRVLPDTPYDLAKLRAMDADVRLRAQRINAPKLPIDDMDAHLKLDAGLLQLEPLNFGVAGGNIRSNIRLDARQDVIQTRLQASVRRISLGGLFPPDTLAGEAVGRIGGDFNLAGTGNSVAAMLGSANGDVAVGMGAGRVSNLLVELAGIDVYETLKYLIGNDKQIPVRCAFADFGVQRGVMESRAFAFDTTDTIILGEGTINLREEQLDLLLRPRPKDRSILALRTPLTIGGTFASPSFRPDLARLGLRGAIALALGSIAPPAALLATLELGGGEDSGCGGPYAK
ncbi:AsmA family protein [Luteimonas fraxinea]|uniref:AsmA family protein n=1 Tax=Luteimonas fraxinea TaxID=2901869 RepID=A0ABS8UGZ0_9GAMM|nr:AsmA family protein [Luteimonas fraxinea]MCD9097969.1 AsmA family protein [Luteimonas fraxinea]MCD9125464.1 AsmA family protein [Luteimonas fraxinea]UHH09300.1 AsmA family protein [Luteimonas fraxinea]